MENKENDTNDISYVDEKANDSTDLSASKESLKKVDQVSNKLAENEETDDGSDEKSNDKRLRFSHMDDIPTVKFRDVVIAKKFGSSPYDSDRVQVEYFSNEKSLKERLRLYFIKNQRSSLRIRVFNFIIKFLTCVLYAIRVNLDDSSNLTKYELPHNNLLKLSPECWNRTWIRRSAEEFRINPCINWDAIVYIKTPLALWIAQVVFAFLSYTQTLLMLYLSYKGNLLQIFSQVSFLLDTLTSFTLIMTIWWPPSRYVYIPIFLNCWLAKRQLENMFNDLNRAIQKSNSAFAQRLMILAVTISCLVFTGSCAIQHFQRGGNKQLSLFESFWYIVVTFSTVGYGDIYPDIWPSQLFMILLIIAALVVLPSQFEQLVLIYVEKQKRGTSYSRQRAETEKHVVVCSTTLQHNIIMDFLNEFYAHPMLQNFYVVLLSPSDLDQNLSAILQTPIWSSRVIYIQGSALNNSDLNRAQIEHAEACFIMAARNYSDRQAADHHTILRSWAIRDFAPNCIQYIHLLKPENKMHVQHAKYVVCEDEFKYALLANNCLCPGLSTFVTLLLHTSRGREGSGSNEEWQKLYGKCSGNEIYHIKLGDSKFFGEYEGKTFTYASFHAHRKFGVALVGVQPENDMIKLNAGPHYVMKSTDICFYMSITKEENSSLLIAASANQQIPDEDLNLTTHFSKKISFRRSSFNVSKIQERVSMMKPSLNRSNSSKLKSSQLKFSADDSHVEQNNNNTGHTIPFSMSTNLKLSTNQTKLCDKNHFIGSPPIPPYVCCSSTICHLLKEKQSLCCLKLNQECPHSKATQVKDYNFEKKAIILASEYSNIAIYNFIVPLRSYSIPKESLNPILLLFEKEPSESFLEIIRYFPLVYWMKGSIDRLEDLLRAGINESEYLIIVNKERSYSSEEQALEDCHTILSVQYIFRMFPKVKVCSEIVDANNMRFMQFRANDQFSLQISKREKIEVEKGSNIAYLFRTPFAGGNVFSATMLDTLLYQSFVKNYLINFVRLMLGIDQAPGSGHLSCKKITTEDSWIRTYGRLYQSLCSTTYDIPVGIYRTDQIPREKEKDYNKKLIYTTNMEISKIVQTRMEILHINQSYYSSEESNEFSYVIMNPSYDLTLKTGDIILIIKPNDLFQEVSTN